MAQDWSPSKATAVAGLGGASAPVMSGLSSSNNRPSMDHGYKDRGWGILFWLHFLVIVALAASLGTTALRADSAAPEDDSTRGAWDLNSATFLKVIALACAVGAGSSALMLLCLQRHAHSLISFALYSSAAIQGLLTVAMFLVSPIMAFIMGVALVATIIYIMYARKRIPFAAAHMETAVAAVRMHPGVFCWALTAVVLQACWALLWTLAAFGLEFMINNSGGSKANGSTGSGAAGSTNAGTDKGQYGGAAVVFIMLLSLTWGSQLLKYTINFVVSDSVVSWWFSADSRASHPVSGAVKRAWTTSFGSLAFASFVIAFLDTARRFARAAEKQARERREGAFAAVMCLASCILGCVEEVARYMNTWAIPLMAMTGKDFAGSGRDAIALFKSRGWEAIITNDLTGDALRIASLMAAALSAVTGAAVVFWGMPSSPAKNIIAGTAGIICFVIGFFIASLMMGVLASAVRTVFVAFAMDPAALRDTHPEYLHKLASAWQAAHPQVFQQCGYASFAAGSGSGSFGAPPPPPSYEYVATPYGQGAALLPAAAAVGGGASPYGGPLSPVSGSPAQAGMGGVGVGGVGSYQSGYSPSAGAYGQAVPYGVPVGQPGIGPGSPGMGMGMPGYHTGAPLSGGSPYSSPSSYQGGAVGGAAWSSGSPAKGQPPGIVY